MNGKYNYPLIRIDCHKHRVEFSSLPIEFKPLNMNEAHLKIDGHEIDSIQYVQIEKGLSWTTLAARINPKNLELTEWGRKLLTESQSHNFPS